MFATLDDLREVRDMVRDQRDEIDRLDRRVDQDTHEWLSKYDELREAIRHLETRTRHIE